MKPSKLRSHASPMIQEVGVSKNWPCINFHI
jgi:hypothetical protein